MKDTSSTATERVGRYQLLEPIGIGCCGAVARAKVFGVAGFERQFAVKKFHAELTSTAANASALSAAARAYGSLEHPRIARMSEFGVAQGTTFTAVEFVAGLDAMRLLAEIRLAGGTLAAGGALTLVSQAARAVGYAHGRGLSHLGLAPTNVIVTADGDIKITDFGVLAATLPAQPTSVPRLVNRIAYLSPEQIAGEATSAATDVFALGVIAYELVTGQRAFKGDSPAAIAKAITSGPPPEPPLPRPIVRVLQRCLARSPFERFPDARALADALDAALRVAPVPGTRKDIGAQVKETLERLAALNEGGHSGVVALNVGTGPIRRVEPVDIPTLGRDSQPNLLAELLAGEPIEMTDSLDPSMDVQTLDFERPDHGPAITQPDMHRAMMTMPGVAPPPIPVPQGISPPLPALHPPGATQIGAPPATLLGLPAVVRPKGMIPQISTPSRIPAIPGPPSAHATPPPVPPIAMGRVATRDVDALPRPGKPFNPDGLAHDPVAGQTILGTPPPPFRESAPALPEPPNDVVEARDLTPLPPPMPLDDLNATGSQEVVLLIDYPTNPGINVLHRASDRASTDQIAPLVVEELQRQSAGIADIAPVEVPTPVARPVQSVPPEPSQPPIGEMGVDAGRSDAPSPSLQWPEPAASPPSSSSPPPAVDAEPKPRSLVPLIVGGVLGLGVLVFIGWQVMDVISDEGMPPQTTKTPKNPIVAGAADASVADPKATPDATVIASTTIDAKSDPKTPVDAGVATELADAAIVAATVDAKVEPPVPTGPSDKLVIGSTPKGAHVYLDGADVGLTPQTLPGSNDRHNIALLLPGHDLYVAQVDGHGTFTIPLKEVTPTAGPAGIKVNKCPPNRYYVFVDGKPTGMLCPTERIQVDVGAHVIETYDAVTEARRKVDVAVKDTRFSVRVPVE